MIDRGSSGHSVRVRPESFLVPVRQALAVPEPQIVVVDELVVVVASAGFARLSAAFVGTPSRQVLADSVRHVSQGRVGGFHEQ